MLFIAGIISVAICIYTPIHLANAEQTKTEISLDKLRKIYNSPLTPQSLEDKYIRRNGKRIAVNFQKFQSIMPINEDNPSDKGETLIKNMPIPFLLKMSHEEQQKLNKWFNDYQSYFEDLDRIIAENNHLRLSSTWRNFNELLYGMSLIEYGFIRSWARTYRSRSIYYVNKGKIAEAINLIPLQQRVISYSASDFSLISYLVRIACLDIFRLQIENLVASKKLPAKKVKELIIYLRKTKEQNIEDLETAFCGETTIAIDCLDRLRDEYMIDWTTNPKEFNNSYYQSTNNFFRSSIFYNYLLAPRKYAVEKEYKLCYDFFIARSDLTNPNTEKILDNMTRDAPISYTFFDLIAMDFDGAYIKKIEIDNSLEALIGILYIELFRQKFNRLPKDFAEMEKFSADFPKFNEKWRYINGELTVLNNGIKSKRHGFRIYNIGRNNEDNNGLHGREKVKNSPTIYHDDANSTVFTD